MGFQRGAFHSSNGITPCSNSWRSNMCYPRSSSATGYAEGTDLLGDTWQGSHRGQGYRPRLYMFATEVGLLGRLRSRSDGEPAISAVMHAIAAACGNDDDDRLLTVVE
eukprot:7834716-Heterocapsa_arctica.AAC.1